MVQKRGNEQKQQRIKEPENILLKGFTTISVRNYDQNLKDRFDSGVARTSLFSEKLLPCQVSSRQLQIFERRGLQLKERASRASKRTS
ncbi:hypothetical protein TNCV_2327531 [Trichonephila clavipes]|nr:hypothetical protein TNCV_2327531 [Trichonephila clavipes]